MTPTELWSEVRECFSDEEGNSLPTVELRNFTADEIRDTYLAIRSQSRLATHQPTFWHNIEHRDVDLDEVSNAADLVTSGEAAPLSIAVEDVAVNNVRLPTINVEVFQDAIALSYCIRDSWDEPRVYAFFTWLASLIGRSARGTLEADDLNGPTNSRALLAAWQQFLNESVSKST